MDTEETPFLSLLDGDVKEALLEHHATLLKHSEAWPQLKDPNPKDISNKCLHTDRIINMRVSIKLAVWLETYFLKYEATRIKEIKKEQEILGLRATVVNEGEIPKTLSPTLALTADVEGLHEWNEAG